MKTTLLILTIFLSTVLFSQEKNLKEQITNNWMWWSVSNARTDFKSVTRVDDNKEPRPDFVISNDGTYNIPFENIGKGTWRLEGNYIFLWGEDFQSKRTVLKAVLRVNEVNEDKMILTLLSQTKTFDWEIELVPFN